MIVVTTSTIEGGTIKRYIDTVYANTVVGTNLFSDFAASFTDIFGGSSGTYKRKLDFLYASVRKELERKAAMMGANCIVGFRIDFDEISGKDKSMFMVSASGTACLIEYSKGGGDGKNTTDGMTGIALEREMECRKIVEKLKEGSLLNNDWEDILIDMHPIDALEALVNLDMLCRKDSNYSKEVPKINNIISAYPRMESIPVVYNLYLSSSYDSRIQGIIRDCRLFDPEKVFDIIKSDLHYGISLLKAQADFYDKDMLLCMKKISDYLKSLPDTGKIEKVKSGLLKSKEEDMFICQNGHKNPQDEEFCSNGSCGVNIKGLLRDEVDAINEFNMKVGILSSEMNA